MHVRFNLEYIWSISLKKSCFHIFKYKYSFVFPFTRLPVASVSQTKARSDRIFAVATSQAGARLRKQSVRRGSRTESAGPGPESV